uniref:hypothetical protein n=1 Tax=Hylemonella sp. TaxID=2066020 RepID=UPI0035B41561
MDLTPDQPSRFEEPQVPRWVQIPVSLVLAAVILLCLAGSLMMVFLPNEKAPILAPVFGVFMALVSVWGLAKCLLLLTGRRVQGGLIKPQGLRVLAWFFLLLPVGGLFSGYFITHTAQAIVQTVAYVSVFFGLRALAEDRERNDPNLSIESGSPTAPTHLKR